MLSLEFVALSRTKPPWFRVLAFNNPTKASNILSNCACLKEPIKLVFCAKCCASIIVVITLLKFSMIKLMKNSIIKNLKFLINKILKN
jgi:hypothetical protein